MAHYVQPYGHGGGQGRGRGICSWEIVRGKPPTKPEINPDPGTGRYKLQISYIPRDVDVDMLSELFGRGPAEFEKIYLHRSPNARNFNWGFIAYNTYEEARNTIDFVNRNYEFGNIRVDFASPSNQDTFTIPDMDNQIVITQRTPVQNVPVNNIMLKLPSVASSVASGRAMDTPPAPKIYMKTVINERALRNIDVKLPLGNYIMAPYNPEEEKDFEKGLERRMTNAVYSKLPKLYTCLVCDAPTSLRCCECRAHYCSVDCQVKGWPDHSKNCEGSNSQRQNKDGMSNVFRPDNSNINNPQNGYRLDKKNNDDRQFNDRFSNDRPFNNRLGDKHSSRFEDRPRDRGNFEDRPRDRGNFEGRPRDRGNVEGRSRDRGNFEDRPRERGHFADRPRYRGNWNRDTNRNVQGAARNTVFEERRNNYLPAKQNIREPEMEEECWNYDKQTEDPYSGQNQYGLNNIEAQSNQRTTYNGDASQKIIAPTTPSSVTPYAVPTPNIPASFVSAPPVNMPSVSTNLTPELSSDTVGAEPGTTSLLSSTISLTPGAEEEVLIVVTEAPGLFYALLTRMRSEMLSVQNELEAVTHSAPYSTPVLGGVCVAMFDNTWARCLVTSLEPLTVFYMDYGNSEILTLDRLYALPASLATKPSLAIKMKLVDSVPEKYFISEGENFTVKLLYKESDHWLVTVVEESEPSAVDPPQVNGHQEQIPSTKPAATLNFPKLLPGDQFTEVRVTHMGEFLFVTPVASMAQRQQLADSIQSEAERAAPAYIAANTKCLARSPTTNLWGRGCIVSTQPLQVKFVDVGNTDECNPADLKNISPHFASIPLYAIRIKPKEGSIEDLYEKNTFSVKPLYKDESGCWIVEVIMMAASHTSQSFNELNGQPLEALNKQLIIEPMQQPVSVPNQQAISTPLQSVSMPILPLETTLINESVSASVQHLVSDPPNHCPISSEEGQVELPDFLKRDQFTDVVVVHPDNAVPGGGIYFVGNLNILKSLYEMSEDFRQISTEPLLSPKIGDFGVTLYDSLWYRVRIVSLSPLQVYYMDFGNTDPAELSDIKKCPDSHKGIPPLVYKVKLIAGTDSKFYNLEFTSQIRVKPVSALPDGTIIVQIESDNIEDAELLRPSPTQSSQLSTPISTQPALDSTSIHFVDQLKIDYEVMFIPSHMDMANRVVLGTVLSKQYFPLGHDMLIEDDFENTLNRQPLDPNFTPNVGALVGYKEPLTAVWQRGEVLEVSGQRWFSRVDHGGLAPYSSCKTLPSQYAHLQHMGAVLRISPPVDTELFKALEQDDSVVSVNMTVVDLKETGLMVQCVLEDFSFSAELEAWHYNALSWPLPLVSGAQVCLVRMLNTATFLVVPADDHSTLQIIQNECLKVVSQKMSAPPKVGDFVVSHLQPANKFVRAKVLKIDSSGRIYTLLNIDRGIEFKSNVDNLIPVPDVLCKVPCRVNTVYLLGVTNVQQADLSQAAWNYISGLLEQGDPLNVELETDLGLVRLKNTKGEVINQELQEILTRKHEIIENGKFTKACLPPMEVTFNEEVTLLVIQTEPLFVQEVNKWTQFNDIVQQPLQTYSESNGDFYNPCSGELCIAKFGVYGWYRAVCVQATQPGEYEVLFIDYGNVDKVPSCDIRKIHEDFVTYPAFGIKCKILGLPDDLPPQLRAQLEQILPANSFTTGTFKGEKDGEYFIDIPILTSLQSEV